MNDSSDHMLRLIWEDVKRLDAKLDGHISENSNMHGKLNEKINEVKKDLADVKGNIKVHGVKIGSLLSAVAIAVTLITNGIFAWMRGGGSA